MSGIKYYALKKGEEPPEEFVVIKHVNGEPEFVASYINTDYLSYQNGVLLKFHERNDKLRAENAKLRELAAGIGHLLFPLDVDYCAICPRDDINHPCPVHTVDGGECLYETDLRELGIEVD